MPLSLQLLVVWFGGGMNDGKWASYSEGDDINNWRDQSEGDCKMLGESYTIKAKTDVA